MKIYTIYKATCTKNNKVYIGFDSKWPARVNNHKCSSKKVDTKFYRAIRKHGFDSFEWEPIYQSVEAEHTLKIMEPFFIDAYDSFRGGYNSTKGGDGTLGLIFTEESRAKMSKSQRGCKKPGSGDRRKRTPEQIAASTLSATGRVHSPQTRKKMSDTHKGKPKSPEHIESMKQRWQDNLEITCPHCNKIGPFKSMMNWHMDNCKLNPEGSKKIVPLLTCSHCAYTAKMSPNFYRNHEDRCKLKPTTTGNQNSDQTNADHFAYVYSFPDVSTDHTASCSSHK